ncbi:dihydrofolate reductase family protein [Actinoallomurus iriomotensis]|uniref:Dihydrofolate reductase n=1 Tax=Actinoallomurus iriomotensis TaxID=478107 RepID=A0A9W6S525_9ACTN|nr:dihydrofolate reductase family protein [Actinoallomurus iriomotensis]GLY88425.1 dihydrofolate reductase [Actinoallomurus iriomotensis]
MRIRTHMAVSVDGYIASPDGLPTILTAPDFESGLSHGLPEFIAGCGAVVMGRNTFAPAVGSSHWPWPNLRVFVLTSQPLPEGTPADVVSAADPAELLRLMREADFTGDVHLVGGQQTIQAFRDIDALDELGVVVMPVLLGDGLRLTPDKSTTTPLQLTGTRTFPDGSVEHVYTPVRGQN